MAKDDGGSAFPTDYKMDCPECKTSVIGTTSHSGMSLRDWFAGQAIVGLLTTCANPRVKEESITDELVATTAYELADAMLKEREKACGS